MTTVNFRNMASTESEPSSSQVAVTQSKSEYGQMHEILGLTRYGDRGISVEEIRSLTLKLSDEQGEELKDIPWIILGKLMRLDFRCIRDGTIQTLLKKNKAQIPKEQVKVLKWHTMDIALMIFQSCDMIVQQMLIQKLALCRLAVPFLIPPSSLNNDAVVFPSWALSSLCLQWVNHFKKDSSNASESIDVSLTKHPFKKVVFARLGNPLSMSKSHVLNHVISSRNSTFYDKETSGGSRSGRLSNGLVEMSYYLPQRKDDMMRECLFLNLRGNGLQHELQCDVLSKIATVVVCFIHVKSISSEAVKSKLRLLRKNCNQVIIQITNDTDEDAELPSDLKDNDFTLLDTVDFGSVKNARDTAQTLTDELIKVLTECHEDAKSLTDLEDFFRGNGITIDQDASVAWNKSKGCTQEVFGQVKPHDIVDQKKGILPLQGPELTNWVKLLKDKHRGKKDLAEDVRGSLSEEDAQKRNSIEDEMSACREKQLEFAKAMNETMKRMIELQKNTLIKVQDGSMPMEAYLILQKRLKMELDDLSRSILPKLRQEYKKLLAKKDESDKGKKAVEDAGKKMDESSFGIEHLFREMGQIYECVYEADEASTGKLERYLDELPDLVAQYFLTGHSFELMNGDSGAVPLSWVKAVFDSLHKLIPNKKMYVLSVVGIQSSGKSTLLNTMFGLELAVGAGRCTRGVYAQLIPVSKDKAFFPVDYVLVLDSEGLCSTSLDGTREHDNEIATLVIGLAELTIVNIMGENKQQMKDIFSIAVNAFLRMKCVKEFKSQKCIFLHQNVAAVNAAENLMMENHEWKSELDKITAQAAADNYMAQKITEFSHVITFNCDKDIFFFPNLWNGEPPLAHIEPGYSDKIKEVRDYVIQEIERSTKLRSVTAKNMAIRIEDIWQGILSDDFLFNFKNNLDLKAYLMLESKYYELVREAEHALLTYVNDKCTKEIEKCSDQASLDAHSNQLQKGYEEICDRYVESGTTKLEEFFEESDLKKHLLEYKEIKERLLGITIRELAIKVKAELQYVLHCKQIDIQQDLFNKSDIQNQANVLAVKLLKEEKVDANQVRKEFDIVWKKWETSLKIDTELETYDVSKECSRVLHDIFKKKGQTQYLKTKKPKDSYEHITAQDLEINFLDYKKLPEDIQNRAFAKTELSAKLPGREKFYPEVVNKVNEMLKELKERLEKKATQNTKFEPQFAQEAIEFVLDAVEKHNQLPYTECIFTLKPMFEGMIATRAAAMARSRFQELNDKFEKTMSIRAKLASFKAELFAIFVSYVNREVNGSVADFLFEKIKHQLTGSLRRKQTENVLNKILQNLQFQKQGLLVAVLEHLAEKGSFTEYKSFIENVFEYAIKWIESKAGEGLFKKENGTTEYFTLLKSTMSEMMKTMQNGLHTAINRAKESDNTTKIAVFVDVLMQQYDSIIAFTDNDVDHLKQKNVIDFEDLETVMMKRLDAVEEDVLKTFEKDKFSNVKWEGVSPYKQAMDRLWGCRAQCPLCLAPCLFTDPNHVTNDKKDHECLQHWPKGFTGTRWKVSEKLSTDICSFSITSRSSFNCSASRYICRATAKCKAEIEAYQKAEKDPDEVYHPHKDYKMYLPDWEINRDSSGQASKYWQWVMAKFPKDLAKLHGAKQPDLPKQWSKNKADAIKSLHKFLEDMHK